MRNGMEASVRRWLGKVARDNYWRVAHWVDLEDLLQDGLLCWQIAVVRYPEANSHHRTKLFQTIYINHLHKLANKRSAQVPEVRVILPPDSEAIHNTPDAEGDNYMLQLLDDAPPLLRRCLTAILADPALLARPYLCWGQRRETTNEWLARLVGVDANKVDLHGQLQELLGKT